ncbi:CheY-like superfamily [Paraphysoderma sedebokerense]|nr:CheY-like superfamily [Paraphysoderma sedebokerense]
MLRVAIIDDDRIQLKIARKLLLQILSKHNDLQIDCFTNPLEGLEALSKRCYSLILTDIDMPAIDGFQTVFSVRSNHLLQIDGNDTARLSNQELELFSIPSIALPIPKVNILSSNRTIPILMISSNVSDSRREAALTCGANEIMQKPLRRQSLEAIVTNLLSNRWKSQTAILDSNQSLAEQVEYRTYNIICK